MINNQILLWVFFLCGKIFISSLQHTLICFQNVFQCITIEYLWGFQPYDYIAVWCPSIPSFCKVQIDQLSLSFDIFVFSRNGHMQLVKGCFTLMKRQKSFSVISIILNWQRTHPCGSQSSQSKLAVKVSCNQLIHSTVIFFFLCNGKVCCDRLIFLDTTEYHILASLQMHALVSSSCKCFTTHVIYQHSHMTQVQKWYVNAEFLCAFMF